MLLLVLSLLSSPVFAGGSLVFEPVALPADSGAPIPVTQRAWADGKPINVGFHELIRVGDQPNGSPFRFGQLLDAQGQPFPPDRGPFAELCNEADYNGIVQAHGKWWMFTHFECMRGEIYLTELSVDSGTGLPSAVRTAPIGAALQNQGGVYDPCSGVTTDWGTMLGSEEYEPDARQWSADTHQMPDGYWLARSYNHLTRAFASPAEANPYRFGWVPELTIQDAEGAVSATKHYAMGRFSHEISRVMPDQRTVYQSDDGRGAGWFLFVADEAADLSRGTLYAAQWTLDTAHADGSGRLTWVNLGHATDADIAPFVEGPHAVRFDDLFDTAPYANGCPATFSAISTMGSDECLRLRAPHSRAPNPAQLASRLETRRYAALLGATVEWMKGEGVASDAAGRHVYVSFSSIVDTMTAGAPVGIADHIRLPANPCGAVYAGNTAAHPADAAGRAIASEFVMVDLWAAVRGIDDQHNGCRSDSISNPDNIVFIDAFDTLAVAEDTRRSPDALWMVDVVTGTKNRVLLAPDGAEVTGLSYVPQTGWLMVSLQGPGHGPDAQPYPPSANQLPFGAIPSDRRSVVGVFGPLPTAHEP